MIKYIYFKMKIYAFFHHYKFDMTRIWVLVVVVVVVVLMTSSCQTSADEQRDRFISAISTDFEKSFMSKFLNNCTSAKNQFGIDVSQRVVDTGAVRLELWRSTSKESFRLFEFPKKINASNLFNATLPSVIFIHGFLSSAKSSPSLSIIKELNDRKQHNVFTLDSSGLLKTSYLASTTSVYYIGQELGKTLALAGIYGKNIHLIGHSLGAHIAGFAGKSYEENSGVKIARISGLDPAGPCYFQEDRKYRLNNDDADFVDVIHTNMGVYGYMNSIGDVDFFPNNGERQPGCSNSNCSHSRSWELFIESIKNPKAFPALKCDNWIKFCGGKCNGNQISYMGFDLDSKSSGKYYLRTNDVSPYSLGETGVRGLNPVELLMYWLNTMRNRNF